MVAIAAWLGLAPANARYGWRRLLRRSDPPIAVTIHTPPPEPQQPEFTALIGLPGQVRVFGREEEVADIRARLQAAPGHARALVNSGAVLAGQGRGRHSDAVAQSLNNLGTARRDRGRWRAAARLMAAALGIRRGVLAADDARLGISVTNVGACWLEAGDAARAEKLLREGLKTFEAAFAAQPQHPYRRNAADWLIACLLVRARGGVNTGARQAEAKRLCAQYGFDYAESVARARQFPDTPT